VGLVAGALLVASGCANNAYVIAGMSPSELQRVGDADLCYAQYYRQSPAMSNEIKARRLDCRTGARLPPPKAAKKSAKAVKPGAVAVGEVSAPPSSAVGRSPVDVDAVVPGPRGGGAVDLDAVAE
jgi:hypothetical protein